MDRFFGRRRNGKSGDDRRRNFAALVAAALLAAGCGDSSSPPANLTPPATSTTSATPAVEYKTGREVLDAMSRAYLSASTYADAGVLVLTYVEDGQEKREETPFSVAFERPGKIRLQAYEATVVGDGRKIYALHDRLSGYAIVRGAPPQLAPSDIYADAYVRASVLNTLAGAPPQMPLLLHPEFVADMCREVGEPKLIEPREAGGESCHRVQFSFPTGANDVMVYWVGEKSLVLRRIEFSVPSTSIEYLSESGKVTRASLAAEFVGAALNGRVDAKAFAVELPPDTKEVKRFDVPPRVVLGKPIAEFNITALDGGRQVSSRSLAGKVLVISLTDSVSEPCLRHLKALAAVHAKFKDNEKVRVLAVCLDDAQTTDDAVRQAIAEQELLLDVYRDAGGAAAGSLCAARRFPLPTALFVGADGRLQKLIDDDPNRLVDAPGMSAIVEALLAGQDLFAADLAAFEEGMMLEEGAVPAVPPAPKSEPQACRLVPLWTLSKLPADAGELSPGNVYTIASPNGDVRIFFIDGFQRVIELDGEGKVVANRNLRLPEGAVVAFLRTATDQEGKRYFALSKADEPGGQVFVYDDQWNQVLAFPADRSHPGIKDAQLADLDGDGALELVVSYVEGGGVQAAALDGALLWHDTSLREAFSVAAAPPDENGKRSLLCTHSLGTLAVIGPDGKRAKDAPVYNVQFIVGAELGRGKGPSYSAIGLESGGSYVFAGFSLTEGQKWAYPLPGQKGTLVEPIVAGRLLGDEPHWIVPAGDASIHFLAADGKLLDRFNYGSAITGLATAQIGGKNVLIVAGKKAVEAWSVEAK
ncbi:MAG: TlpA family protein disulfide reductase [Planctomycetia bacterium]|nr:TlpA family protein disulfide reductase [Planctomycetia bacterium]